MELQQKKPQPMYWQSLEELHGDPEVLEAKHHEFKKGVTEDFDINELSGISRRRFLAAMSASAAFALASCSDYVGRRVNGEIVPYNEHPNEIVIGRPNYYASTVTTHMGACPVLIKAREGRPLKVIGNADHPLTKGRIESHFQARISSMYDPSRLTQPVKGDGSSADWIAINKDVQKAVLGDQEMVILTHRVMSPTAKKVLEDLQKARSNVKVVSYGLLSSQMRDSAWKKSYGQDRFPAIKWDQPNIILALDSDFLGIEGDEEAHRLYSTRRDVLNDKSFNRLYVAEGNLSQTGMNADYRMRVRPDNQLAFVLALAKALQEVGVSVPSELSSKATMSFKDLGVSESLAKTLLSDLKKNMGKSLIYAGDRLPESVHIAVNALNAALGAEKLYDTDAWPVDQMPLADTKTLQDFVKQLAAGKYAAVVHWNTNPVYDLAGLNYAEALSKAKLSVSLNTHMNETGAASAYVLPIHHDFECWGDYETRSGYLSLQQPIIHPLYDTRQAEGIFLSWTGEEYSEKLYMNYLKKNWMDGAYRKSNAMTDFNQYWSVALHDGFVKLSSGNTSLGGFKSAALSQIASPRKASGHVLSLHGSYATLDGEFADNGWLQEIPHPVSKVVWDNYAAMSVGTAKALGVKTEQNVQVSVNGKSIVLPVLEQPGMAEDVIAIEIGYGRTKAGDIGSEVGVDALPLVDFASDSPMISKADVSPASGKHHLVTTQNHHAFDIPREQDLHYKRGIVHEANYLAYEQDPHSAEKHGHKPVNVTSSHTYEGIKWEMAIDMNKCTGCNACVMACNIENNIPVVGPDQVDRGREMHWMRLDRYYSGTPEEPKIALQVMLCQHCDNAPCEVVCPVNATNHSPDGLNQMAYNRCVGTRYCSNNCPYKVRRFNFYDYRKRFEKAYYTGKSLQLQHNPEVTVRSRGVMEKCTFCVQRIMWARQEAIREKRELKGSDVITACQEVCPSEAIYFGDINDSKSMVSKHRKAVTGYQVLEEWNARPAVTYVAKLRNTYEEA